MIDEEPPPPFQIAANPNLLFFYFNAFHNVPTILVPDAPNGCPIDKQDPFIFQLFTHPNYLLLIIPTYENG